MNKAKEHGVRKVLDLGCGSGRHLVELAKEGFGVTGVDFSPAAAHLAEKWLHQKGLEGDVIVADFDEHVAGIKESSQEAIIAINSLEYGKPKELGDNLKEINRILRTGGLFLLVYRSKETELKHPEVETQFYTEEELKEKIQKTFRIIEFSQDEKKNFVVIAQEK